MGVKKHQMMVCDWIDNGIHLADGGPKFALQTAARGSPTQIGIMTRGGRLGLADDDQPQWRQMANMLIYEYQHIRPIAGCYSTAEGPFNLVKGYYINKRLKQEKVPSARIQLSSLIGGAPLHCQLESGTIQQQLTYRAPTQCH